MPCERLYGNKSNFPISTALHNDTEDHFRIKKNTLNKLGSRFVMQSKHADEYIMHSLSMLKMHCAFK